MISLKNCPLCKSSETNFEVVFSNKKMIPEPVVICRVCALIFKSPRMSNDELKDYYFSNQFSLDNRKKLEPDQQSRSLGFLRAEKRCELISEFVNPGSRMIDVGSGDGAFVETAYKKGYDCRGIDMSSSYVHFCQKRGLNVELGQFPDDLNSEDFDCVTSFHMIEHTPDPLSMLQHFNSKLKRSGYLAIEYPDCKKFLLSRKNKSKRIFCNRSHLIDFTYETIKMSLNLSGFKVEKVLSNYENRKCSDKNVLIIASLGDSKIKSFVNQKHCDEMVSLIRKYVIC